MMIVLVFLVADRVVPSLGIVEVAALVAELEEEGVLVAAEAEAEVLAEALDMAEDLEREVESAVALEEELVAAVALVVVEEAVLEVDHAMAEDFER